MNSPRAAIYTRVSTTGQEESGSSLGTQETACREFAEHAGYVVSGAHVFAETFSGIELWDRPKLTLMRNAIRAREIDRVVCYAIDRLSRDPVHLGVILSEAEHAGVPVEFVSEPMDDSPEGQLIRFVRGYAAKVEHMKIRERSVRGKKARAQSGKIWGSGHELYGYRRDKDRGVREIYDQEAAIVRELFEAASRGDSLRALVKSLNARNVPSPGAGKMTFADGREPRWGWGVVRRILRNPEYKGEAVAWKTQSKTNTNLLRPRPENEWIPLPEGTTPAIVSSDVWDAVQARLSANTGDETRNARSPYLLRGHVYCSVCGSRLYSSPERGKRMYRCSSRDGKAGACGAGRVPAEPLEQRVWEAVSNILTDPSLISQEIDRRRAEGPDQQLTADLEAAEKSLLRISRQQEKLLRKFRESEDDSFPWDLVQREIAAAEGEKRQLQDSIHALQRRIADQEAAVHHLESIANYVGAVKSNLSDLSFDSKRLTLKALDIEVRAAGSDPAKWTLLGSIPIDAGELSRSYLCVSQNTCAVSFSLPMAADRGEF